jgi:L-threonylcarbamoyladenylate synthase
VSSSKRVTEYIFDKAECILKSGGLVIVPTETFYAIAADPRNETAVRRIFLLKGRDESKPLPLIAADRLTVERNTYCGQRTTRILMDGFWPGSLTIVLHPALNFASLVTGAEGRIGVRVPPWCSARILACRLGGWITATSANPSGDPSPDQVSQIPARMREGVDLVMNLGPSPGGKPSTVVEPYDGSFRILREGAIEEATIRDCLERSQVA